MDRMEILKLALSTTKDAREALTIAREMAAFLAGQTEQAEQTKEQPAAQKTEKREQRVWRRWTKLEELRAATLLDNGASYAEVGRTLKRTERAVMERRFSDKLPVKKHQLNPLNRLAGAMTALHRGERLKPKTQTLLNGMGSN